MPNASARLGLPVGPDAKSMRTRLKTFIRLRLRQNMKRISFSWRIQKKPLFRIVWHSFLSVNPLMREAGLYIHRAFLCGVQLRLEEEGSPVSVGGFHPPFIFGNTITFVPVSISFVRSAFFPLTITAKNSSSRPSSWRSSATV